MAGVSIYLLLNVREDGRLGRTHHVATESRGVARHWLLAGPFGAVFQCLHSTVEPTENGVLLAGVYRKTVVPNSELSVEFESDRAPVLPGSSC